MGRANKTTHFSRRMRNQVLINRRIEYKFDCNLFEEIKHSDYRFLNKFYTDRIKAWENNERCNDYSCYEFLSLNIIFFGPQGYPWEEDTKCYFFSRLRYTSGEEYIFVFPYNWLCRRESIIPIFFKGGDSFYFNSERCVDFSAMPFIVRNNFYACIVKDYPLFNPCDPRIYPTENYGQDWCITYLNPSIASTEAIFISTLLWKNIDFSTVDARVARGEIKCPIGNVNGLKIKNRPEFLLWGNFYCPNKNIYSCICAECRQDCKTIVVDVEWSESHVNLTLLKGLIKFI